MAETPTGAEVSTSSPAPSVQWTRRITWPVLLIGVGFWWMETDYFGWNATPQSEAELICDGIAMLIQALAFLRWNR